MGTKKKITLSLILMICMLLALSPTGALADDETVATIGDDTYSSIEAAVAAAATGDTISLTSNAPLASAITVSDKELTLDLNGHTMTASAQIVIDGADAKLTIEDSGTTGKVITSVDSFFTVKHGELNLADGTFTSNCGSDWCELIYQYGAATSEGSENYSVVTIGANAVLNFENDLKGYGVRISPPKENSIVTTKYFGVVLNVYGTIDSSNEGAGIYVNGTIKPESGNIPEINIHNGASVTGMNYAAGRADWNISGGTFSGSDTFSIKAGTFHITGGSFTSTGAFADPADANNNGSEDTGAAISITNNDGYAKPIEMTITGGTFTSTNGYALYEGTSVKGGGGTAATDTHVTVFSISGGTFQGAEGKAAVSIATYTGKPITGGTYSTDPTAYVAANYTASGSGPWTVAKTVATPGIDADVDVEVNQNTAAIVADAEELSAAIDSATDLKTIVFDLTNVKDSFDTVTISKDIYDVIQTAVTDDENSVSALTIQTNTATLCFDSQALAAISNVNSAGDVSLKIQTVPAAELDDAQAALIGNSLVLNLEITNGDTAIHDFGTGAVTVSIPVTGIPQDGMIVWRMETAADHTVTLTPLACTYNADTKCYEFKTSRFSEYVLSLFPYKDVPAGQWYYETMVYAVNNNIYAGTSTTTLEPDANITRAQIVQVLWRLEGEPQADDAGFTDVAAGAWYAPAINWAGSVGIVDGMGDHKFAPEADLTREQMVKILYAYAGYLGYDISGTDNLSNFTDASKVSTWALKGMGWAVNNDIITGMGNHILDPQGTATRAQFAKIMQNFSVK